ncbi:DEAD/DEAH box helicase, partial [Candidatus Woesearchaeota archaeon]|nr:DEAD/DEAH box helicase [Candidatus Woesearchaeota archaeon]
KDIVNVLSSLNFVKPLEVQELIVPLALQGKNVVFTSRTGSGKTLAYLLGFLGKINNKAGVQMIVMVPTRELCIQVGKEMKKICDLLNIKIGVLYGGRDMGGDHKTLVRKNQIYVGTPGRLIQHINEKHIRVGDVNYVVYDESDQMFDQGFYDECVYLKSRVCKNAQIILSSATITEKVQEFIQKEIVTFEYLKIGVLIPETITQEIMFCKIQDKNAAVLKLFSKKKFKRAIIFCNTKVRSNGVAKFLDFNKYVCRVLNSDLEQKDRQNYLNLFKESKVKVIIATDVAARGLHIENVDIVVNYDVPTKLEFYVHRIGRTGRGINKGYALTFVCPEDVERFKTIKEMFDLNVKEIK